MIAVIVSAHKALYGIAAVLCVSSALCLVRWASRWGLNRGTGNLSRITEQALEAAWLPWSVLKYYKTMNRRR
jgi:hypothetical protein